jgi:hypothetical protein
MKEILAKIASLELQGKDRDSLKEIIMEIKKYYADKGRHSYSEVSTFIYGSKEEDFEYIIENLTIIQKYFKENKEEGYAAKIFKLIDHIQLELNREEHIKETYYNQIMSSMSQAGKDIKTYNDKIVSKFSNQYEEVQKKYNNLLREQKNKLDNLYGTIISVLGIFSAVVIAFFGGISVLGSALNNINAVSKYRLIFSIATTGFVIFNIIFMLLYIISKLVDKPIKPSCNMKTCNDCNGDLSLKCLWKYYPIVFWYNVISLIFIFIDLILYIVDKYNIITYMYKFKYITDYSKVGILSLAYLFILIIIIFYVTTKYLNNDQNNKENITKIKAKGIENNLDPKRKF